MLHPTRSIARLLPLFLVTCLLAAPGCQQPPPDPQPPAPEPAPPAPKTDRDLLQGNWGPFIPHIEVNNPKPEVRSLLHGRGVPMDEPLDAGFRLEVKGDVFQFSDKKSSTRWANMKLDPTKEPKEIDLVVGPGKPILGIYKLDGDRLGLCLGDEDNRPTEFTTKVGRVQIWYQRGGP
jgi:uncharacterized protein (TIGR03067 family)